MVDDFVYSILGEGVNKNLSYSVVEKIYDEIYGNDDEDPWWDLNPMSGNDDTCDEFDTDSYESVYSDEETEGVCPHTSFEAGPGGKVCTLCGKIIFGLDYSFDRNEEGSRCQYRTVTIRSIDDVFHKNTIEISECMMDKVDEKYRAIVKFEKVRGKSRDALVAICLMFCLRREGDNRTLDDMKRMFFVSRKDLSSSLYKYYKIFPEDRTVYLHPEDLVKRILILQNTTLVYEDSIKKMCTMLKNKSKLINRSTPQSVASAVTFIYLKPRLEKQGKYLDKKEFAKRVFLSEITIDKIVKEITNLFLVDK